MTKEQAVRAIIAAMSANLTVVQATHYVLWFLDTDNNVHAYDAKDPVRGVHAIMDKHPELIFKHVDPVANASAANELCKWMRIAREARTKLMALKDPGVV